MSASVSWLVACALLGLCSFCLQAADLQILALVAAMVLLPIPVLANALGVGRCCCSFWPIAIRRQTK